MSNLLKLTQLPAPARRLLLEAALALAFVRLALWCLPFRVWSARPAPALRRLAPQPELARLAWAIAAAAPLVPRSTCLVRALAAQRLFARYGHNAAVRIGVANLDAGRFAAHAWLDHAGDPVIGAASSPRYTRIWSL
jgi:hypothetical protein